MEPDSKGQIEHIRSSDIPYIDEGIFNSTLYKQVYQNILNYQQIRDIKNNREARKRLLVQNIFLNKLDKIIFRLNSLSQEVFDTETVSDVSQGLQSNAAYSSSDSSSSTITSSPPPLSQSAASSLQLLPSSTITRPPGLKIHKYQRSDGTPIDYRTRLPSSALHFNAYYKHNMSSSIPNLDIIARNNPSPYLHEITPQAPSTPINTHRHPRNPLATPTQTASTPSQATPKQTASTPSEATPKQTASTPSEPSSPTDDKLPFFMRFVSAEHIPFLRLQVGLNQRLGDLIRADAKIDATNSSYRQNKMDHIAEILPQPTVHQIAETESDGEASDSMYEQSSEWSSEEEETSEDGLSAFPHIRGINTDHSIHPYLAKIYDGDYNVYGTSIGKTIIYGDYPILRGIYIFYGTRSKLFDII